MTSVELVPLVPGAMERIDTMVGLYESGDANFSQICRVAMEGFGTSGAAMALTLRMANIQSWHIGDADLQHALENGAEDLTVIPGLELGLYRAICRRLGIPDEDVFEDG